MNEPQHPFLVLTLRRTGATTFTQVLSDISSFATIQHEPFNGDRQFGQVTTDFERTGDTAALAGAIDDRLHNTPNIKHCIETVPFEVTAALVRRAMLLRYGIVVITREDEGARLLSLSLAKLTGAWGPDDAARRYEPILREAEALPSVNLDQLRAQMVHDFYLLGRLLHYLKSARNDHVWLTYEEIYESVPSFIAAAERVHAMLRCTKTIDTSALDRDFQTKSQDSRRLLDHLPNACEVKQFLAGLAPGHAAKRA